MEVSGQLHVSAAVPVGQQEGSSQHVYRQESVNKYPSEEPYLLGYNAVSPLQVS